jgi:hypothetical protein
MTALHPWATMLALVKGYSDWHRDPQDHSPSILLNCGATIEFDIATEDNKISTVLVRPGEWVCFDAHLWHRTRYHGQGGHDEHGRWAVSYSIRERYVDGRVHSVMPLKEEPSVLPRLPEKVRRQTHAAADIDWRNLPAARISSFPPSTARLPSRAEELADTALERAALYAEKLSVRAEKAAALAIRCPSTSAAAAAAAASAAAAAELMKEKELILRAARLETAAMWAVSEAVAARAAADKAIAARAAADNTVAGPALTPTAVVPAQDAEMALRRGDL